MNNQDSTILAIKVVCASNTQPYAKGNDASRALYDTLEFIGPV